MSYENLSSLLKVFKSKSTGASDILFIISVNYGVQLIGCEQVNLNLAPLFFVNLSGFKPQALIVWLNPQACLRLLDIYILNFPTCQVVYCTNADKESIKRVSVYGNSLKSPILFLEM